MSSAQHPDFVLFPPKMMATQPARKQQYYSNHPIAMDPNMVDMFSFPVDGMAYPQISDYSRVPQSYFDAPGLYPEAAEGSNFASMPPTPPSITTSQSEPQIPTGSAASGPSIASGPSSAMGSPHSGPTQAYQDNWVNTNHGLGLPVAVMQDIFPNDYMGNNVDLDGFYREKLPDAFVGGSFPGDLYILQPY